jgi:hypothetical protein
MSQSGIRPLAPLSAPPTTPCRSVKEDFDAFYNERANDKKHIYGRILSRGALLLAVAAALVLATGFLGTLIGELFILQTICLAFATIGFVALTSVPPAELDLDLFMAQSPRKGVGAPSTYPLALLRFRVITSLAFTLGGAAYSFYMFPYFIWGFLFILSGVWIACEVTGPERAGLRLRGNSSLPPPPTDATAPATLLARVYFAWRPREFTTTLSLLTGQASIGVGQYYLILACTGNAFANPLPTIASRGFVFLQSANYQMSSALAQSLPPAFIFIFTGAFILYRMLTISLRNANKATEEPGWRTALFYRNINTAAGAAGAAFAWLALWTSFQALISIEIIVATWLSAILMFLASAWVPCGGARWAVARLARLFEFNLDRLRKDGAKLASLVVSSTTLNEASLSHWVKRKALRQGKGPYPTSPDTVNRNFWVLGCFPSQHDTSTLIVAFSEDDSPAWSARYVGDKLVLRMEQREDSSALDFFKDHYGGPAKARLAQTSDPRPFDFQQWCDATFDKASIVSVDAQHERVTVKLEHAAGGAVKDLKAARHDLSAEAKRDLNEEELALNIEGVAAKGMELWATRNLRYFPWSKFDDSLLKKSPREEGGCTCAEDKGAACRQKECYSLSNDANKDERIDFFLSHAWDDPREAKVAALRGFFEGRSAGGSSRSTLWFDKTCITQCADPGSKRMRDNAIAALPVNVGACKKMLVLLGPEYLKRIWCVWELQSVFTFCVKELALERIEVVPVGGFDARKALSKWTLDEAHCFDPNEEYRLRRLVHHIGEERFYDSVRNLALCIK